VRVAALYDVHGNLPALEAVLAVVEREGVDAIVFGGDIAAGPFPRETVELVRWLGAVCIRGNADRVDAPAEGVWEEARQWIVGQLGGDAVAWLDGLPFSAVVDDVLYVHATPRSDEETVTELTTDERLEEILAGVEQRLVVAGHTHMQLRRGRFVNAGSVGRPCEGTPGAYWALIGEDVEFRHTDYDYEAAAAAVRATSYPRAEAVAAENVLRVPTREQALAAFGG
jgi:predicted phosphodiesterase